MRYIDTHIHLDGEEFKEDLEQVVQRAKNSGAEKLFIPAINMQSVEDIAKVCQAYPDYCYGMVGLHPEDVREDYEDVIKRLRTIFSADTASLPYRPIAIGEVGLDFYWSREYEKEQLHAFELQVQWAIEYRLPLMIHCRKAQNEMVKILRLYKNDLRGGVFHCFTGNEHEAEELLQFDKFVLGIGGVLTFKKSLLPQTLPNIVPLERIVLETDAPYMAPVPHRGERNESSFIPHIIEKMAEAYDTTPQVIADTTTENALRTFPLATKETNDTYKTKKAGSLSVTPEAGNIISALMLCLFTLSCFLLTACNAESIEKKGDKAEALGEYFVAADFYRRAYAKTPSTEKEKRGLRAQKMAYCYEHINNTNRAIGAYRNAARYHVATIDDSLRYARLLLKAGDYKQALDVFLAIKDSLPDNPLVSNGIESATKAAEWKKEGSQYKVKKMDLFNSRRDDYSPCLGGEDYDRLYFTSTRNDALGDELNGVTGMKSADIFYSEKDDKGKWSRPEAIGTGLNTEYDEGACCLSPDGQQMYLTQCTYNASGPRYATVVVSNRSDALWGKASAIELTKDTLSCFAHPAISPDGQWLYFVSDMPGGKGGLDIWRTRIVDGKAMGVENLGEPVNTPGNEMFPTFRPNGDLYFSSDGHPGMGGLDVFIAKIGKDMAYHITHPGYPLNSAGDDFGLTFEGPHNRGFFSSSRGDARGNDHIYWFENPEVVQTIKGWIYEQDGYELPQGEARIVGTDGTNERITVKTDGSFEFVVTPGVEYIILGSCAGFLNHKEEMIIPEAKVSETYTLQFALASINAPVLIDNIFYEFNKATLLQQSTQALDSLVMLLNENPNITIELGAHTDYKGSAEYNKHLSQLRAEEVVKYLIKKGIAPDRLQPVGYGKEKPKRIRRRVAERYPWLKEGDVLTEEFIQKLKSDEQETANALNRRTEFTVLRTTYNMFDEDGNLKNPPVKRKRTEPETQGDGEDLLNFEFGNGTEGEAGELFDFNLDGEDKQEGNEADSIELESDGNANDTKAEGNTDGLILDSKASAEENTEYFDLE